jgi:hypothetical protein
LGRQTKVIGPDGSITPISYAGNQTPVTDPALRARTTSVDGLGRTQKVTEDPNTLKYSTTYGYDPLNRPIRASYTDATPAVSYAYDNPGVPYSIGQLTGIANANSSTAFTAFDPLGRVTASPSQNDWTFSKAMGKFCAYLGVGPTCSAPN